MVLIWLVVEVIVVLIEWVEWSVMRDGGSNWVGVKYLWRDWNNARRYGTGFCTLLKHEWRYRKIKFNWPISASRIKVSHYCSDTRVTGLTSLLTLVFSPSLQYAWSTRICVHSSTLAFWLFLPLLASCSCLRAGNTLKCPLLIRMKVPFNSCNIQSLTICKNLIGLRQISGSSFFNVSHLSVPREGW